MSGSARGSETRGAALEALGRSGRFAAVLLPLAFSSACGAEPGDTPDAPTELPHLTLSEPVLEIGVVDGADEYIFGAIESVVPLGDGSVGVSDGGSMRISLFTRAGDFLRRWGQQGDGPAEFRSLARLYPHGQDSVMAVDRRNARMAVFDLEGELGRNLSAIELSRDSTFSVDSWLHGRFWVEGGLMADTRQRLRAALDRLPPPRLSPGYRSVVVDQSEGLWIIEPGSDGDTRTWTRTNAGGTPIATVSMPLSFRPTYIDGDELYGVWTGEADVNFARVYRLADTGDTRPIPAWMSGAESAATTEVAPDDEELMDLMRNAIRSLASAQEIHYSTEYSYTTDIAALEAFEQPEGIEVGFTLGTTRGWAAVFTHPSVDRVCGLAYGFGIPAGWTPGAIICGPSSGGSGVVEG